MKLHHLLAAFVFITLVMFSIAATALPIAPARIELMVTASLLVVFVILWVLDDIDRGVRNARMRWSAWRLRRSWIKLVKSLTPEQLETMREAARESGLTLERVGAMLGVQSVRFDVDIKCERRGDYMSTEIELEPIADPVEARVMLDPENAAREHAERIDRELVERAQAPERGTTGTTRAKNDLGEASEDRGTRTDAEGVGGSNMP